MSLDDQLQQIPDVSVEAELIDGKLSMTTATDATLRIKAPDHQPLSAVEPHLELYVATADTRISLELDAAELDALADAIERAQGGGE